MKYLPAQIPDITADIAPYPFVPQNDDVFSYVCCGGCCCTFLLLLLVGIIAIILIARKKK